MQIELTEFEELGLNDRLHLLGAVGTFLTRVMTFKHMYVLYNLYGFYVEIVISYNGKATKVSQAIAFDNCNRLNKYLKQIDLSDLGI